MTRIAATLLLLTLGLAGCGDDEPPPPASFPPLHYGYLKKLSLNVGTIDIQDQVRPMGDDDVSSQSPVPPAQALSRMAHDRLFAAGSAGQAVFTIERASILRGRGGAFDGELDVRLDVTAGGGAHVGSAEAHVAREHVPGSDPENTQVVLYDMTRQMMDDMNVELEFQLKRSLRDWLMDTAAVPAPVSAQPLPPAEPPPGLAPMPFATMPTPAPPATGNTMPPATPPEAEPDQPPPPQMSPPPGFLQLPPAQQPQPY